MSVSITKRPLLPVITIKKDDDTLLTYNPFTPTFDFRVRSLQFEPPYDSVGGKFDLRIVSANVTNADTNTLINNISGGNEVTIWVGKTDATKTKLFLGIVEVVETLEPNKDFIDLRLSGPDWGSAILKNRIVFGEWRQKFQADGITLDSTDTAVLISQITTDLLTKTTYYPAADITVENQGVVVTAANIVPIDVALAQFTANFEKLDDKLADLDKVGLSVHFVDPNKNFIMKQANVTTPTGILLVDDTTDSVAVGWDQTKVGLILPNPAFTKSLETHKRRLFGLGGDQTDQVDQTSTTDAGTPTEFYTVYLAQRFTPQQNNVYDIAVRLSKVGTPIVDPVLELWEEVSATPTFGTNLKNIAIDKNAVATTANWHLFSLSEKLNTKANYWIVMRKNGEASHHFRWHHDNVDNSPSTSATSSDGLTWTLTTTPNRFKRTHRQYYSTPLIAIENTTVSATAKHFFEDVIKEADITKKQLLDFLLLGESETAFKIKQIFHGMIYSPDTLIQTGDKIRIRKNASGIVFDNDDFVVGAVSHVFQSSDDLATGTFTYDLIASRFATFA